MKKKVLMSLLLLAIIGTSAVFAQAPTLDKLRFTALGTTAYSVSANNSTGAVVIPNTYDGKPVTRIENFSNSPSITSVIIPNSVTSISQWGFRSCTGLTSITIPASVTQIAEYAFQSCTNLTSVTFEGSNTTIGGTGITLAGTFPGDLRVKYQAGGPGTYTRQAGSTNWTKQSGQIVCPHCNGTGFISR